MDEAPTKAPEEAATEEEAAPPPPPAVEYSEALPFLVRRASLGPKGALVGDVGFDPLGFTEVLPLVRASLCARLLGTGVALGHPPERAAPAPRARSAAGRQRETMAAARWAHSLLLLHRHR